MKIEVQIREKEFEEAVARKNLTMTALAERLEINRVYLSNIKNSRLGSFRPSAKLRERILEVLGVQFDDVFKIINHKNENMR